ncbi:hypothetical protein BT69DRAFT_1311737 [Atractiella rhizophila]|nr:hypothetical protein BT69DRAFT_1311737 [Atractiella rhizophila]
MATRMAQLHGNLKIVRQEILEAISRRPASIDPSHQPRLLAVSKRKPAEDILAMYEESSEGGGQRDFGENYVQELEDKAKRLPSDIRWHFIGGLQSNKCKTLAAIPSLHTVQSVDCVKKADILSASQVNKLNVFLQVNTSGEDQKSGLPAVGNPVVDEAPELLNLAEHILKSCPALSLNGLMTIGSWEASHDGKENVDFTRLIETRDWLEEKLKSQGMELPLGRLELSMGMSADFAEAVARGSDVVRVGTKLFGER